jgi:hypothetical protein
MKKILSLLAAVFVSSIFCLAQNDTIKILAIGNSFSDDAIEDHLHGLAKTEGLTIVIGNIYKGGCSIERHVRNLRGNITDYEYRKIDAEGVRTIDYGYTMERGLADEDWDYVSFQQGSAFSGIPDSYALLPELVEYVKARVPEDAVFMFHQTWAYSKDSKHKEYHRYDNDQMKMYNAIVATVEEVIPQIKDIKILIPSGTAIQNARTSILGDDLTRDGYHLSRPVGRYVASCTWLQAALGINPVGNTYCPEGMTPEQCKAAQKAARKAVKKPSKITTIK